MSVGSESWRSAEKSATKPSNVDDLIVVPTPGATPGAQPCNCPEHKRGVWCADGERGEFPPAEPPTYAAKPCTRCGLQSVWHRLEQRTAETTEGKR